MWVRDERLLMILSWLMLCKVVNADFCSKHFVFDTNGKEVFCHIFVSV